MKPLAASENWLFEIKAVRAIKCKNYGDEYTAIAHINIVDGDAHVEGLLSKDDYNRADTVEIEGCLKALGFKYYFYSRWKKGEKRLVKKALV